MKTDTSAAVEWAWELKSELLLCLEHMQPVAEIRNVPRYRGQDIKQSVSGKERLSTFPHVKTTISLADGLKEKII